MSFYQATCYKPENVVKTYIGMNVYFELTRYQVNAKGYTIKQEPLSKDEVISLYGQPVYDKAYSLHGLAFNQVLV